MNLVSAGRSMGTLMILLLKSCPNIAKGEVKFIISFKLSINEFLSLLHMQVHLIFLSYEYYYSHVFILLEKVASFIAIYPYVVTQHTGNGQHACFHERGPRKER